jgi:hypothetical protein
MDRTFAAPVFSTAILDFILGLVASERDARQYMAACCPLVPSPNYFDDVISRTTSCMRARYRFWLGSMREAVSSSPSASS